MQADSFKIDTDEVWNVGGGASDFLAITLGTTFESTNELVIMGPGEKVYVRIHLEDGSVEFGEDYEIQETARVFWNAMGFEYKKNVLD